MKFNIRAYNFSKVIIAHKSFKKLPLNVSMALVALDFASIISGWARFQQFDVA